MFGKCVGVLPDDYLTAASERPRVVLGLRGGMTIYKISLRNDAFTVLFTIQSMSIMHQRAGITAPNG